MSDTEYHAKLEEFEDQLLTLATDRARAETLRQVNEQNQRDALQRTIDAENAAMAALAAEAKKAGTIDYGTDVAAANQFDAVFSAVKADPGNAGKPLAELVNKAHRAVLAIRGIDAPAPAPSPAPAAARAGAPAPAPARAVPTTLSGLPNAGQTTTQDSTWEQYSRLSGPEADDFLARLPASQVDRILRMADNYGLAH